MSKRLDSQLATDALIMALAKRGAAPMLLHSDQGTPTRQPLIVNC